jgi:hypothetical protein
MFFWEGGGGKHGNSARNIDILVNCKVSGTPVMLWAQSSTPPPPHSRTLTPVLCTEQYVCPGDTDVAKIRPVSTSNLCYFTLIYSPKTLQYSSYWTIDTLAEHEVLTSLLFEHVVLCSCTCNTDAALEFCPEVPSDDSSRYCFLTEEP